MSSSSKSKKHSKAHSRASSSTPEPNTPSENDDVEQLASLCEHASTKFPSFISKSTFFAKIIDFDTSHNSKGCRIWLSEPSMVSYSLTPGSIVSVSIASSGRKNVQLDSFPLKSLVNECARCYGLENGKTLDDEAGNYFALATVFPSRKVLKNGVRLSSNLSYTMGCPPLGSTVFVHPVQKQYLSCLSNGGSELHSTENNYNSRLMIYNCKELHLQLVPHKNGLPLKIKNLPSLNLSSTKSHVQSENDSFASPRTPFYGSKLSNASGLSSPIFEDSASSVTNQNSQSMASFDVRDGLGDESNKKLLETCATSWLYSRCLLLGNLVNVPMLSEVCIFQVVGAKNMQVDRSDLYSSNGSNQLYPEDSDTAENVNQAIVVNCETKVFLSLPSNAVSEETNQSEFSSVKIKDKVASPSIHDNISKLGGLSKEYTVLKDIISSSVEDALSSFGLRTTRGVLLHGPSGTGKTSLAQLCAHDVGVNFFPINGPELVTQYYGESEQALHEVFDSAIQAAPAVVFIDELDAIAPARKDGGEELSQRMVATLLNLMDGVSRTEGLLVIAATNRPDHIEPALRRPGRFDKEIEIGVPSPKQRLDILLTLLNEVDHTLSGSQIEHLATVTHGFVGADLAALCNEAALICLRHYADFKKNCDVSDNITEQPVQPAMMNGATDSQDHSDFSTSSGSDMSVASNVVSTSCMIGMSSEIMEVIHDSGKEECTLTVSFEDFQKARMKIRPSAMREVILEVPKVNWKDVGGQKEVKAQLMEAVEWPQKHHDAFDRIGTRPPTGVLMFGPPGCSKTLMARAVASEAGLNFLAVKGPELFSKWVGESEKAVRSLFAKARANAPSIVFFDEIDSLAVTRGKESDGVSVSDRVMSQLLVEMDGLHQRVNVTVIAATNRPDKIDPALLRPGRFDRLLYVGPPNKVDREEIFRIHLRKIPCGPDVSIEELACLSDGCTGADISLICREAAVAAIEESLSASVITMKHLKMAIKQVQPSEVQSYQKLSAKFQRAVHCCDIKDEFNHVQQKSRSTWFNIW
ncbi:putative ATPase, AAA-type, core, P-loop containing nucleoside triphosphate hydrolase [Lupinus albus]|uniref:Putative ATPase, AAA-type, core, P-loop containing nucleoside triphosphate hydrolase n=1 Tax=Lupinus albus TaxID=3870 RepID=A0A6A4P4P6_LUPAL|nr:putative ATPase, AAA-type, core, P-loop containing nucleoside triphosphate hydrolase [Lupinus albus]